LSGDSWTDLSGFDLETLRREGLERIRDLSGALWTDHALHDPGITLLEQLCYALSELAYFTAFDIRDHLTDADGRIDFPALALFAPEDVFPCRPATLMDYARLLLGGIPKLEDARLQARAKALPGLYEVRLQLDPQALEDEVRAQAMRLCHAHRNLGEDFEAILVSRRRVCHLHGEIKIDGTRPVAQVYAEVFATVRRELSAGVCIERHQDALARGKSIDAVLSGPFLDAGWIPDKEFERVRRNPSPTDLARTVEALAGVRQVDRLELCDEDGRCLNAESFGEEDDCLPVLELPGVSDLSILRLSGPRSQVQDCDADFLKEVRLRVQRSEFEMNVFRIPGARDALLPVAPGRHRDLSAYTSIQKELPGCYGVGNAGVPNSQTVERRMQALQLKGYLFPFEQAMADFQATVSGLSRTFSLNDTTTMRGIRPLDKEDIPRIDELYLPSDPVAALRAIDLRDEDFFRRRIAVLDHLLGTFGEEFPEWTESVRSNGRDPFEEAVQVRLAFLRELPLLGRDRMGASDLLDAGSSAIWLRRISLLLGLRGQGSATAVLDRQELVPLEDEEFLRLVEHFPSTHPGLEPIKPSEDEIHPLRLERCDLAMGMVRCGGDLGNYRLLPRDEDVLLLFQETLHHPAVRVAAFPDRARAALGAERFCLALQDLERSCEVMHVVEHVLLRSRGRTPSSEETDFCTHRVTVVLPSWNSRGRNLEFRKLARRTIGRNFPAHLSFEICWLDIEPLREFEMLQESWRQHLRIFLEGKGDATELDREALRLREFLHDCLKREQAVS